MNSRREIAEAATVIRYPDGSRELVWEDGIRRRYTRETLAGIFLDSVERGQMNPLLERLLTADELREMTLAVETLTDDMAELVGRLEAAIPQTR